LDSDGSISLDESSIGDEWNAGEEITVALTDEDQFLNRYLTLKLFYRVSIVYKYCIYVSRQFLIY
jgi:hypothetical protein